MSCNKVKEFDELESGKESMLNGALTEMVQTIVERVNPILIILFGSQAKETATVSSDVDFFIVQETKRPMDQRGNNLKEVLQAGGLPVDLVIYTPEELQSALIRRQPFIHSLFYSGKVVYKKDNIINKLDVP